MDRLILSKDLMERIIAHCRSEYPDEACGLISGTEGRAEDVFHMTNVEKSPVSYYMDPGEQFAAMKRIREQGMSMLAIYHSHPCTEACPSPKDISLAFYPDLHYMIVGLTDFEHPVIRAFSITGGQAVETMVEMDGPADQDSLQG